MPTTVTTMSLWRRHALPSPPPRHVWQSRPLFSEISLALAAQVQSLCHSVQPAHQSAVQSTGTTTTTSGSLPKTALMAMIKAVDVELTCDDVLEIWVLLTDLFEDDGHLGPAHRVFADSQPLRMTRWRSMASL